MTSLVSAGAGGARLVRSLPRVPDEAIIERQIEPFEAILADLSANGLGVRMATISEGTIILPLNVSGSGSSRGSAAWSRFSESFLQSDATDLTTLHRGLLRAWRSQGRMARYAVRTTGEYSTSRFRIDHLDALARLNAEAIIVDVCPAGGRVGVARRRLGLDAASSSASVGSWSLGISVIDRSLPSGPEMEDLIFADLRSARVTRLDPGDHVNGERWVSELFGDRALVRSNGLLNQQEAARFFLLPASTSRQGGVGQIAHPLGLLQPSLAGASGSELSDLVGDVAFRHTLVTGDPGTGKSTALQRWLVGIASSGGSVTVIDPAKSAEDYSLLADAGYRVIDVADLLPLNPFVPAPGTREHEYVDLLVRAIDQSTGLTEGYPLGMSVLRNSVEAAYRDPRLGRLPGFADVIRELYERVAGMAEGTSPDVRVAAVSVGERLLDVSDAKGRGLLCGDAEAGLPWSLLTEGCSVLLLRNLGSRERRTLVSLLVVAGLTQHHLQLSPGTERHLVLEEAHLFFPSGVGERSAAGVLETLLGEAVAELRASKLGVTFVEQRPSAIPSGIRSICGNVVAFRNSDRVEADCIGSKLNLRSGLSNELVELPDFHAYVRLAAEPSARLRAFSSQHRTAGGANPGVPQISLAARQVRLPWCEYCPHPCQGYFALDAALSQSVRPPEVRGSRSSDADEMRLLVGSAAQITATTNRVPAFDPLDGSALSNRQVTATFCIAAHHVATSTGLSVDRRQSLISILHAWTRRGTI